MLRDWMFQVVFTATAAKIVSGAMAERTKLSSYLIYTVFITALIYPAAGHWLWNGEGWLAAAGDCSTGVSLIARAINSGRETAAGIIRKYNV